ncbi:MAG: hypothetical protein ACK5HT_18360, partial [Draconibacterium sp.]
MNINIILILVLVFGANMHFPAQLAEISGSGAKSISYVITTDASSYTLIQVLSNNEIPKYYYRDIKEFPCHTENECYMMNVRIYWDIYGNFLQFELGENEALTKLNHKKFSEKDYRKFHKILSNPNSNLKYCKFDNLTLKEAERDFQTVDAVSSATAAGLNFEYIKGAVKTTYSLWHIVHGEVRNEIRQLTNSKIRFDTINAGDTKKNGQAELFKNFPGIDDVTNIRALNQLINNQQIDEKQAEIILNDLKNQDGPVLNSSLEVLKKQKLSGKQLKEFVLPLLNTDNNYVSLL